MFKALLFKEIRQFTRSKSDMFMMFIFPIILITTLGFGLNGIMNNKDYKLFGEDGKRDIVYYNIDEESIYSKGFNVFINSVESEVKIKFKEVSSLKSVKSKVDNYNGVAFVKVSKDGFNIYTSNKGESFKSQVFKSIFNSVLNEYSIYETVTKLNKEKVQSIVRSEYKSYIKDEGKKDRQVNSKEYYTFAELALIILYIASTVGEKVYKENDLTTINRIRLSKVSEGKLIFAKASIGILIGIIQTLLVYVYSSLVLKVNWGDNTIKFLILFIVFSIFASILGVVIGLLAKKDTTVTSVISVIIFTFCTLGGAYVPLQVIVSIPVLNKIMYISPNYWINTATSTMICGYKSNCYTIALLIPISLSVILLLLYYVIMKKKGGLKYA